MSKNAAVKCSMDGKVVWAGTGKNFKMYIKRLHEKPQYNYIMIGQRVYTQILLVSICYLPL